MTDVFDSDFARNPWPTLERLRVEGGVHRVRTPDGPPAWLVTRYRDVRAGLLDERLSTRDRYAKGDDYRGFPVPPPLDLMLSAAPDDHARLRSLITAELSPRRLAEWTDRAPRLVNSLLRDGIQGETVDMVERLAVPLPAAVLAELLGLDGPTAERLRGWANSTLLPSASPPRARDTLAAMLAIMAEATAQAQRADTVLGRWVAAHLSAGSPTGAELTGLLFYLLFVWYEVLADLIAGSVLTLLGRPDQRQAWQAMGDKRSAVDEMLRYLSPQVLAGPRFATTDLVVGATTIPAGQTVLLCLASANHDPEIFHRPAEVDLARERGDQLALGYGMHACLGNALVHTVTAAALDHVLTRWPDAALAVDEREIVWRSGFRHRGPVTLPVRLR
ncbi:cytochrome P450 [Nocardia sp. CDC186]|uniref:Cytochrome P450 n=1 Tax=Nocardia implantans TaxID=3108168 RepID=A0ABU6AP74_9NOCA|nr:MULTISPECIES: cytochrome P450 [unclassified Nocardia]MBF6189618.1 cytochrome P450 [Nocardia beijingensis]MEA3527154.1 cytochrome P450 [Nocardia sp. CDC192]MEB3509268.1 cytochrome P450 [Nocardia sp. CDC186]